MTTKLEGGVGLLVQELFFEASLKHVHFPNKTSNNISILFISH